MTNPNVNHDVAVIADVHGCYTKLKAALEPLYNSGKHLIFLGDLIDRAPEENGDINVVRLVHKLQQNPEEYGLSHVTVLKGNHEEMLLHLKMNPDPKFAQLWLDNGGSYDLYKEVDDLLPWIDALPCKFKQGKYLFVHAGVKPGVPLGKQRKNDLLWIRDEFLDCEDHGLPYIVVHGHSVVGFSDTYPQRKRISLDMGACFGGPLEPFFIDTSVDPFAEVDGFSVVGPCLTVGDKICC